MAVGMRGRGVVALLAAAVAAILVATAPPAVPSELAMQRPLRLPEPQELILPDPGYQTGFPEVCSHQRCTLAARVPILTGVPRAELLRVSSQPDCQVCLGVPGPVTPR